MMVVKPLIAGVVNAESWLLRKSVCPSTIVWCEMLPASEVVLERLPTVALIAMLALVGTSVAQTWLALSAVSVTGDCTERWPL